MTVVLPVETPETSYLWEGYRRRQLLLQRCARCGRLRFLPAHHCAACHCPEWRAWPASGTGTVLSYVITRRPDRLPVVDEFPLLAIIQLDEGVRLVSNVTGIPPERMRIGLPVQAYFDDVADNCTLVRFHAGTVAS
jgi:uncharacterized OB-fold protein